MSFSISGIEEVQDILTKVAPRHARNLTRATVQAVASKVAKLAKQNAPKNTGNLKKAIKAKREKSHPDNPQSVVYVQTRKGSRNDGFYWRFIEKGTINLPERPFIRPARDSVRADLPRIYTEEFGKKLEKALAREAKKAKK
jgi:HK97 gp10 family phage protein